MSTSPLRIGIIGFGRFAERVILPAIRASGVAVVTALQKRSRDDAYTKAAEQGVPLAFDLVEELVRHPEVDAVFIASANAPHADEAIAAARAGKHVLVEKPMAATVPQAEAMLSACRAAGVQLMVGHMIRFSPVTLRMKEILRSGEIGTPVHLHSEFFYDHRLSHRGWLFNTRVAGGGPIHDIGVHCIDTMRFILEDEITDVRSILQPQPTEERTEESASISFRFKRGTLGSVYCSFVGGYRRSFIEVRGTEGTVSAFDFTRSDWPVYLHRVHADSGEPRQPIVERIEVPNLYAEQTRLFVEAIRSGRPNPVPGEEGLVNQRILARILGS